MTPPQVPPNRLVLPQGAWGLLHQIGESSKILNHFHQIRWAPQMVLCPSCQMRSSEGSLSASLVWSACSQAVLTRAWVEMG